MTDTNKGRSAQAQSYSSPSPSSSFCRSRSRFVCEHTDNCSRCIAAAAAPRVLIAFGRWRRRDASIDFHTQLSLARCCYRCSFVRSFALETKIFPPGVAVVPAPKVFGIFGLVGKARFSVVKYASVRPGGIFFNLLLTLGIR